MSKMYGIYDVETELCMRCCKDKWELAQALHKTIPTTNSVLSKLRKGVIKHIYYKGVMCNLVEVEIDD